VAVIAALAAAAEVNDAVFTPDFCTLPAGDREEMWQAQVLKTNDLECPRLLEFIFLTKAKVRDELVALQAQFEKDAAYSPVAAVSVGSSLVSAFSHISSALLIQRKECVTEHVRMLFLVSLRRGRSLVQTELKHLWHTALGSGAGDLRPIATQWLEEAAKLFQTDMETFEQVLRSWAAPAARSDVGYFSHEADGRFSTLELLRRDTYREYMVDKGLLKGLLKHHFAVDSTIADVGAGSGFYAQWLNDTGLVEAFAFDAVEDVERVTKGVVAPMDIASEMTIDRQFDYALCLDVVEHVAQEKTAQFLKNLDALTTKGVILTWRAPGAFTGGTLGNPRTEGEVFALVAEHTNLEVDGPLTDALRVQSHVPYIARSLYVFRKKQ
jgi:hypothetical protein